MVSITLRADLTRGLTNEEIDGNMTNLKTAVEAAASSASWASVTGKPSTLSGYGITDAQAPLVSGTNIKTINNMSVLGSGNIQIDGGVTSFNTRTGAVVLGSADVTGALGYTPLSNATGYLPLTGGSVNGNMTITGGMGIGGDATRKLTVIGTGTDARILISDSDSTYATAVAIQEFGGSNGRGGYVGINGGVLQVFAEASITDTVVYAGTAERLRANASGVTVTGALLQGTNQVLHAGNYTSYAASASHVHSYLPLSGGTLSASLDINGSVTIGSSGTYAAGSIYSDANWGMIFRAKQASPGAADFMWSNSAGTELFRFNGSALTTNITGSAATATTATQLVSPNGASVVAADAAFPSAGQTFQHSLALGPGGNDGHIMAMSWAGTASIYGAQIWMDTDPTNRMAIRSRSSAGAWNGWWEVLTEGNVGSYAAPISHTHAYLPLAGGIVGDTRINFGTEGIGNTFTANHYSIGKDIANGGWSGPHYSDLIIGFHTGIRIGASYSGTRFYNNSPTTDANNDGNGDGGETLLMTVGGHAGGTDVVINNALQLSNANLKLTQGDGTGLRITTGYGYINFGAQNASWTHVYSDKAFYTNQNWYVNGSVMLHLGNKNDYTYPPTSHTHDYATHRSEGTNYVDYSRYVYNNGAYSGTGWVEPSDLGVRYASTAGNADTFDGIDSSRFVYGSNYRKSSSDGNMNNTDTSSGFWYASNPTGGPFGDWTHWINCIGADWNPNYGFQLAHAFHSNAFAVRRVTNGGWETWRTVLDSSNYSNYSSPIGHAHAYLPLAGGTMTGAINLAGMDQGAVLQHNGNAAEWYGRIVSKNSTSDRAAFLGTYQTITGVFAHNNALNAWVDLYVNTVDGSNGGTVRMPSSTLVAGSQVIHAGNKDNYTYPPAGHTHDYLPLTGGTLSGYLQAGNAAAYDNPGGWNANVVASGAYHARFRLKATSYNSSGDRETYLWLDNTTSPATGIYSNAATFNFSGSLTTVQVAGNTILHASNYNAYAPTLTGGGASGTWGINISGNSVTTSQTTFSDVYTNGWFRNNQTNQGMYNQATANHWYSENNASWTVGGTNTTYGEIRLRQGHQGSYKGSFYWDSSGVGLLNDQGGWIVRGNYGTGYGGSLFGTWSVAGNTILHAGNYNSYAPTLTGGGASGTWGIHITGNSATASTLQTARTIGGVSFNGSASINLPGVNTAGNQSTTGSAGSLNGYTQSVSSTANSIVQRDANGYLQNSYFYSSGGGSERNGSGMSYFTGFNSGDYYIRSYTAAAAAAAMGALTASNYTNYTGSYTQSKAASGYSKSPNGVIIQWGISDRGSDAGNLGASGTTITFPIAFPTACCSITLTPYTTTQTGWTSEPKVWSYTTSSFVRTGDGHRFVMWMAMGY